MTSALEKKLCSKGKLLAFTKNGRKKRKWDICIKRFIGLLESTYLNLAELIMQQENSSDFFIFKHIKANRI